MTAKSELRERTSYDEDFLLWSEEQAELLRRRAAARPEAFDGLDLEHLVEEVADLGKSELRAARNLLVAFFKHLIKMASDPASPSFDHWLSEVLLFRDELQSAWAPSMRQRIDLEKRWRAARTLVRPELDRYRKAIAESVPDRCPFTLDELLGEHFDLDDALARLGGSLRV